MILEGKQLIGQHAVAGSGPAIHAVDPARNERLEPAYPGGTPADVARACQLAAAAFDTYRETTLEARAAFLETIATGIETLGDDLIQRAMAECGLPRARLEGERARTCHQLRMFADVVRAGEWLDVRVDPALPERKPQPRVDIRQRHIAIGPVAVFGSSNFPLAFSVAGGDSASALAAGCPVIAKAHPAHPGTSEMVGRAIQKAVAACGLPEGVFSLLYDSDIALGAALVADPRIKAVGFTGSRRGGLALLKIAQERREPIPVYAEMSSVNPVFLLTHALTARPKAIAEGFIASLGNGAGQFCTNPGLVLAQKGASLDAFVVAARQAMQAMAAQTMLTANICAHYQEGVARLQRHPKVHEVERGRPADAPNQGQAALFMVDASDFVADQMLQEEVFGSTSLVIACADVAEMCQIVGQLEGQLTCAVHMDDEDLADAHALLPALECKAGRVLVNGWPTGVEVCHAMIHGGPFPATSDSRTTSVGSAAIQRFLRPVCYQNLPQGLLPLVLKDGNPLQLRRLVDGRREA